MALDQQWGYRDAAVRGYSRPSPARGGSDLRGPGQTDASRAPDERDQEREIIARKIQEFDDRFLRGLSEGDHAAPVLDTRSLSAARVLGRDHHAQTSDLASHRKRARAERGFFIAWGVIVLCVWVASLRLMSAYYDIPRTDISIHVPGVMVGQR